MSRKLPALLVASFVLATNLSCVELLVMDLLTMPSINYPKLYIGGAQTKKTITTSDETVTVCGGYRTKKPKNFCILVSIRNSANGFATSVWVVNADETTRLKKWCAPDPIPLEIGKNKIRAHCDPGTCQDGITLIREAGPDPT